jgi:DNA-binding NarL/FixJ family response regulator
VGEYSSVFFLQGEKKRMSITVILADDHAVVRGGIKAVLEKKAADIEVIGEASNGKEVLELAEKRAADVYILDVSMPILNGIEATERLVKKYPLSRVIILSMYDDRSLVEKALEHGARGYVLKESEIEEMIRAVHEVYNGRFFFSEKVSDHIIHGFLHKKPSGKIKKKGALTRREREILQLIGEGFRDREIAGVLNISFNTVCVHRKNIRRKLNIHKQADLVRYACKEGFSKL